MINRKKTNTNNAFILITFVPLIFFYLIRAFYPDESFDVLSYHILNSIQSSNGSPYYNGSFFPILPANPTGDILANIFRTLLGYRLGTVINLILIIWSAKIVYNFLLEKINNKYFVALGTLYVISAANILFEINNYMDDVYSLPVLLESTFLILNINKNISKRNLLTIGFLLGFSVAIKLTNLAYVIPLLIYFIYKIYKTYNNKQEKKHIEILTLFLIIAIGVIFSILPFSVFMEIKTGNPIYPYYNELFNSQYFSLANFKDPRWGPNGFIESLFWPIIMTFNLNRLSELPYYTLRIPLAILITTLFYPLSKISRMKNKLTILNKLQIYPIFLIFIIGSILWSFTTGYIRYAIYLDVLAGIIIILAISYLNSLRSKIKFIEYILILLTLFQLFYSCNYALSYEWGMRQTCFVSPFEYLKQIKYLFTDRNLITFIPANQINDFRNIGAWVVSDYKTTGIEALLNPNVPVINPFWYRASQASENEYLSDLSRISKSKFLYTLCYSQNLSMVINNIDSHDSYLRIKNITPLELPYFSNYTIMNLDVIRLIKSKYPNNNEQKNQMAGSNRPLNQSAFKAEISILSYPRIMKNGNLYTIFARVRNVSKSVWPLIQDNNGMYQIHLGDHWLTPGGKMLIHDDGREPLPYNLQPGMSVVLPLSVKAPNNSGLYLFELDMVQEGVSWFNLKGSKLLKLTIDVK